jgi:hypothetical protein
MKPDNETTEPESSAVIRPSNPAANAVKHGFCSKKILTPETYARAEVIREELTRIHEPWSDEETDAIATLAIARAQQFELELAMRAKVDIERAKCAEIHERNAERRLEIDLANFRDKPEIYGQVLSMTWHGADWLRKLWQRIAELVTPDSSGERGCLPFHLACDAATVLGGPWQVDRAGSEAAWMMARFVRISPEPDTAIELWANQSNAPDGRKFSLMHARWLVGRAPTDPAVAAAELHSRATGELSRITQLANKLRSNYETELANAAEVVVGTGSGDPAMEKEFRLLTRYLTAARNRADRLEKRLDTLKRDRKRLAYRLQRDTEQEARRLKRESEKALSQYENESRTQSHHRDSKFVTQSYPSYADNSNSSRKEESANSAILGGSSEAASVRPAGDIGNSSDQPQVDSAQQNHVELRNGISDICPTHVQGPESAEAGEKSITALVIESKSDEIALNASLDDWAEGTGSLQRRMRMMRYRNWGNPEEIPEDEAQVLRQIMTMPDSAERQFVVRTIFGTERAMRRSWVAFSKWADEHETAAVGDGGG